MFLPIRPKPNVDKVTLGAHSNHESVVLMRREKHSVRVRIVSSVWLVEHSTEFPEIWGVVYTCENELEALGFGFCFILNE